MKIHIPKSFWRDASREEVTEENCKEAIRRAESGLIDADLGGRLIKQRIPRSNQGASRGLRSVIFYKRGNVAVFLHIFPESGKANLTQSELAAYLKLAQTLEKLTKTQLEELGAKKGWREIEI